MSNEEKKLRLFVDSVDGFVAESAEDAIQLYKEFYLEDHDESENGRFVEVDGNRSITLTDIDDVSEEEITKTASEWVEFNGRGFLYAKEW
jgi:hypothetical protein